MPSSAFQLSESYNPLPSYFVFFLLFCVSKTNAIPLCAYKYVLGFLQNNKSFFRIIQSFQALGRNSTGQYVSMFPKA